MKDRIIHKRAQDVLDALRNKYPQGQYAFLTEVGNSTGFRCDRHADAIVMSLWPSRGLTITGIEVKVSRGDWVRELQAPEKAETLFQKCDNWFVAVGDESIVREGELPPTWGLMVPSKDGMRVKVDAPLRQPPPEPGREFLAAVLRQCCLQVTDEALLRREYRKGFEDGKREAEAMDFSKQELRELESRVAAFEKASGVLIRNRWEEPDKIGEAVRQVLHGVAGRIEEQLRGLRSQAVRIAEAVDAELKKGNL